MSIHSSNKATPSVIDVLTAKLTDIKDKLKEGGISEVVFGTLSEQAKLLQDKLNEILAKKGYLTQSDINDAYATLQEVQRKEMDAMSRRSKNRAIIYSVIAIGLIFGAYFAYKKLK